MKLNLLICTCILLTLSSIAISCPTANHTLEHYKRWFGVGNPHGNEPRLNNGWPADPISPWQNALRYCWTSQSDYTNLNPTLQKAIALWQPAIGPKNAPYSNLIIRPDGSGQKPDVLCSDAQPDALQITDLDPTATNVHGHATIGYWTEKSGKVTRGRHQLNFERIQNRNTPNKPGDYDVASMAHELGHALGLEHEHQRPDRNTYVSFFCQNLRDYSTTKSRLQAPDTMDKACTDLVTAHKYSFSAFAFIPISRGPVLGQFANSLAFDYDSIMTYGSYEGATVNGGDIKKAVLLKHPTSGNWRDQVGIGEELYQGGAPVWEAGKIKISEGDMARIAQLYPNLNAKAEDPGAMRAAEPSWSGTSEGSGKRAVETGKVR